MSRSLLSAVMLCTAVAVGCGDGKGPTGPSGPPQLARTRFLAFGDSITAGEVTTPVGFTSGFSKQVLVPAASYPAVLESRLRTVYAAQSSVITVTNAGEPNERILDGNQRFPGVFDPARHDVVLLMEGVNGLPIAGPDISTGVMQIMTRTAKAGNARVFIGSMIPQVPGRPRGNTPEFELLNYNTKLTQMAAQEGVVFVDLYNPMLAEASSLIGSDGLHPTEAGYRRIADLFFAAIQRELQQP
ncbi:MAG TPA: SGNH/GDSL hydrolase family protein [Vicinamibacterales bacterium]|nr:SGNH/GDSL hydrolase family protein [Vicinamibacterales bacterium]